MKPLQNCQYHNILGFASTQSFQASLTIILITCQALLTVTTSEGQVSIDLANRVVSSVGLEYCSSDSKEEQGYTFKGQWKPSENTTMDSMFENVFTDFENATLYVAMIPVICQAFCVLAVSSWY